MKGLRLWFVALVLHAFLSSIDCGKKAPYNRRSVAAHTNLPVSKGGWRPVVGSGGLFYGSQGTAPLHAPYKIPLVDLYPSSSRPVTSRDVNKLTSIAQSYRPTTLRTVPVSSHAFPTNQPINSYLNPFALPNNGQNYYKFVQNFPADNVLIRNNLHNPYAARPVLQKQQTKQKQQYHNNILQQLTNIQPIQFGQYQAPKPIDVFGKQTDAHTRPDGKRPQSAETEIFKPEVYKLPDRNTVQYISQPVKTAQQQSFGQQQAFGQQQYYGQQIGQHAGAQKINQYGHPFQNSLTNYQQFPPSILGTFGSFGLQSIKARDQLYPATKTTFAPQQTTKQTIFNTYNYSPNLYKSTPTLFSTTTPKLTTAQNNLLFGSTLNNLGYVSTPQTKLANQFKIDPNAEIKNYFKPSPQDPFIKKLHSVDYNKVTTYNPQLQQTTTLSSPLYNDYNYQSQNYDNPNSAKINYNTNKHKVKVTDSVGLNQQVSQQYANAPGLFDLESSLNALSHRPSYSVVENFSEDIITSASPAPWTVTPQSYNNGPSEEAVTQHEKPTTTIPGNPQEFAVVTESENSYENTAINYDAEVESQSRRPLGDDFEPITKPKLKDYYYRVSTPTNTEHKPYRRLKKPTEAARQEPITQSVLNKEIEDLNAETLPTLPPSLHFKRPSAQEPVDKDKVRKRNKIRRRRPPQVNRNREEINTRNEVSPSDENTTSVSAEIHTIRPRVKPIKLRTDPTVTAPSVTTELTTSALPTTSATKPTLVKKKHLGHRRTTTPTDTIETTTQSVKENIQQDVIKESSIMKIFSRLQTPKAPEHSYERVNETPDYSHKQDEKDTPTSDVSVSLTDTFKTTDSLKEFSFHRDARPVENKETTTESLKLKKENEATTIAPRTEIPARNIGKIQRPRQKNKLDRPKFSVKDYRSRLNSTTSTTEKIESTPRSRFPSRKNVYTESIFTDVETTTERRKFTPKEPRHKLNRTENNEQEIHSRHFVRNGQKQNTDESGGQKISSRVRNGQRRQKPTEESTTEQSSTTAHKRPQRKKINDSDIGESVQDISVTEATANSDHRNDITSERTRSESAIMKIADKKHQDHAERLFEHSKRVSDLTLAASKDYNTPGMFKTVSSNSRRIPSYFTIATDDPILPIEAFFPQLNQKKET